MKSKHEVSVAPSSPPKPNFLRMNRRANVTKLILLRITRLCSHIALVLATSG